MQSKHIAGIAAAVALAGALVVPLAHQPAPESVGPPVAPVGAVVSAPATVLFVPDDKLTPGAVLPGVTAADTCVKGYAGKVRNVPDSEKLAVYHAYGITSHKPGEYEIDHLISLELGGSNEQRNLWPEKYDLPVGGFQMGAHEKDKAEDATHAAVCAGRISLSGAQKQIAADWTVLYRRFVSPQFPKYVPPASP